MKKEDKIQALINFLQGKIHVDELIPPRFKIRVGFTNDESGQFFINDKSITEQEYTTRFKAATKDGEKIKIKVNYEGSDNDN